MKRPNQGTITDITDGEEFVITKDEYLDLTKEQVDAVLDILSHDYIRNDHPAYNVIQLMIKFSLNKT